MAEKSDDELPLSDPTIIEGAAIDNEEEYTVVSRSWQPSGSGPMGIPRASNRTSPQSAASSYLSSSRYAPHTYGPSSVSSSYSRHSYNTPSASVSAVSRSFKSRAKRDLPRESPNSRRSLLSSLLQQQQQGGQVSQSLPTFTSERSRRQSANSLASDSDCSPNVTALAAPPDWRPPLPTSLSHPSSTSSVSRTHVSISSRVRHGPAAAPRSIMPHVQNIQQLSSRPSIDLVNHDVPDMLKMIASVLKHILNENDALYAPDARGNPLLAPPVKSEDGTQMRNTLLSFHGCIIPAISQQAYLNRILKYCPLTNEVFLASLIYFDRISHYAHQYTVPGAPVAPGTSSALFVLDSYNVHRLMIAAVTVASKFFSDIFYKNSRYAQVGGLPVDELNNLELQFLIILKFNLMVTVEEFQAYADYVQDFYAQYCDEES